MEEMVRAHRPSSNGLWWKEMGRRTSRPQKEPVWMER